ncbi:hypothetical protein K440DRAFT_636069 [Wilcoxina mikolae CBS 423.85]|nr:hypothetical protein K440DRAFT_636069 [Wilcoxina mikolae CBS 423.85]
MSASSYTPYCHCAGEGAQLLPNGDIDRWVLKIMDEGIRAVPVTDLNCSFGDLDGRELVFKTDARPAARYLYFHFLLATIHARKHKRKVLANFQPEVPPVPWATPEEYMRERMVKALVAEAGHGVLADRAFEYVIEEADSEPDIGERALAAHLLEGNKDDDSDDNSDDDEAE